MYFPQFLVGMSATLCAIMGWIYTTTGSLWQSLGWTFLGALLLQAGYVVVVLFLIYGRASRKAEVDSSVPGETPEPLKRNGIIDTLRSKIL